MNTIKILFKKTPPNPQSSNSFVTEFYSKENKAQDLKNKKKQAQSEFALPGDLTLCKQLTPEVLGANWSLQLY